jgi:hypothetical protein
MSETPEGLSPQNEAELETWPDMDPAQQALMGRIWEEPPDASSDAA